MERRASAPHFQGPNADLESSEVKDKVEVDVLVAEDTNGRGGLDSPEYAEYCRLYEYFQGPVLDRLHRKTDWHVIPPLLTVYLLSYIDRANVGNARLFGAQQDLGLSDSEWNGELITVVTFMLGAPPLNILAKIYSARVVMPVMLAACGLTIIGAGCCNTKAAWFALRLLLGFVEAGIYGAASYSLTTWYDPERLASRIGYYYVGAASAGGFSGLLATAIGQADGTWGYRGWRWIYVVEGVFSVIMSVVAIFWTQGDPEKTHRWLTPDEQRFIVLRSKFAYGSDKSGNMFAFRMKDYLSALKSPHVWFMGYAEFGYCAALYGYAFALPTIIRNMGFTATAAQGLSAPPYFIACIALILSGHYSDKYKKRALAIIVPSAFAILGLVICFATVSFPKLTALSYISVVIAACGFYCLTPNFTTWISLNCAGQSKRAAALALGPIFTQPGGVLGSNIYLGKQAPLYPVGFGVSIFLMLTGNIGLMIYYYYWLGRKNAEREAMTDEEIRAKYTPEQLVEMGDRSPYYRYER